MSRCCSANSENSDQGGWVDQHTLDREIFFTHEKNRHLSILQVKLHLADADGLWRVWLPGCAARRAAGSRPT